MARPPNTYDGRTTTGYIEEKFPQTVRKDLVLKQQADDKEREAAARIALEFARSSATGGAVKVENKGTNNLWRPHGIQQGLRGTP